MNINEFIEEIKNLGIKVTETQLELLNTYYEFLVSYNKHTNITRILEKEDVYLKHFYDSLTISKVIDLNLYNNLIDLGSGAGFPGVVIKIFFPNLEVTLLDSNNKKTRFLKDLTEKLSINVNIINKRIEEHSKDNLNKYDVVVARAVSNLRVLSELSLPLAKEGGYFIAMKGDSKVEVEEAKDTIGFMNSKIKEVNDFILLKENSKRSIILIEKNKVSTIKDLRPYDKILKSKLKKN